MIDSKRIINNLDEVEKALSKRNKNFNLKDFVEMDKKRKCIILEVEELKSKQNIVTKEIPILKKQNKDTTSLLNEMKELSNTIKKMDQQLKELEEEILQFLLSVPNVPNEKVTEGKTSEDNIEIRSFGVKRSFDFEAKAHWEIGKDLQILDPERAAKTTGSRFTFYVGYGAMLERAIKNFMLDTHVRKHEYVEVTPPFLANTQSMIGTGQLPKFAEDAFKIENEELYLVPTGEVPVTNMYANEILDGKDLTISHCAYTPCFRAEAGSAGRDTRGLIRQHQFNKVELVKFCKPENSYACLEKLTDDAEEILRTLGLPYRVVKLCGGDLGFSAAMTYDIEVWMPSYNRYVEISSCSNFEDYQARRANIRYKDNIQDKSKYIHTVNGSGLAVGRTTAAILENFQQKDGSISIPDILVQYMGGLRAIRKP
jgi:seryl-tRNA synthetase